MISSRRYSDLLEGIATETRVSEPLCLFTTHVGRKFNRELLVCGRAPNGGDPAWTVADVATPKGRQTAIDSTLALRAESPCSMEWITDWWRPDAPYNTARSAFWRVSRAMTTHFGIAPELPRWSSYLAWTNLYRVAPASRGNPSSRLQRAQLDWCIRAIHEELDGLRPKRLLVMAGSDWAAPFLRSASIDWQPPSGLLQAWGHWSLSSGGTVSVVIAKQPERKPHQKFVRHAASDA